MRGFMIAAFAMVSFGAVAQDYSIPRPRNNSNNLTRGIEAYDPRNNANVRLGTACKVVIYGDEVYKGICNVGRGGPGRRVTTIDTGVKQYKIVREDYDDTEAMFYSGGVEIGPVTASGSCWIGKNARYCAN